MSGKITLHPEKGLAPHLSVCRKCGKDVGVVLCGIRDFVDICKSCGFRAYGGLDKKTTACPGCGGGWHSSNPRGSKGYGRRTLTDSEKIPCDICDECAKKQKECDEAVAAGGVYWKCAKCKSEGAIKPSSPLAAAVREQLGVPEGPCGVELTEKECPVCTVQTNKEGGGDVGESGAS